jgi:hypothetical protein
MGNYRLTAVYVFLMLVLGSGRLCAQSRQTVDPPRSRCSYMQGSVREDVGRSVGDASG